MSAPQMLLTRARLRRDVSEEALRAALAPRAGVRAATTHRLIWSLFGDSADRTRDFLWREAEPGLFYLLSARAPADTRGLFHLDPSKRFAPQLGAGDRLAFVLRANATVARKAGRAGQRGLRHDVVMDAIYRTSQRDRAVARAGSLAPAARTWLARQGEAHGFVLVPRPPAPDWDDLADPAEEGTGAGCDPEAASAEREVRVLGYQTLRIERREVAPMRVGVLDVEGVLEVRDPARFTIALGTGFGRAKAFGCGLMLVRRAPL